MRNYHTVSFGTGVAVPADYTDAKALAANTAEAFTVPAGATVVRFSSATGFYANFTTTATVPGDTTDGSASAYIPAGEVERYINGVAAISVIWSANTVVTASYFKT